MHWREFFTNMTHFYLRNFKVPLRSHTGATATINNASVTSIFSVRVLVYRHCLLKQLHKPNSQNIFWPIRKRKAQEWTRKRTMAEFHLGASVPLSRYVYSNCHDLLRPFYKTEPAVLFLSFPILQWKWCYRPLLLLEQANMSDVKKIYMSCCECMTDKTNTEAIAGVHVCCQHLRPACWGHVTAQVQQVAFTS